MSLHLIEDSLNNRPRKGLNFEAPKEVFFASPSNPLWGALACWKGRIKRLFYDSALLEGVCYLNEDLREGIILLRALSQNFDKFFPEYRIELEQQHNQEP